MIYYLIIENAFLHGDLDEKIYVKQPKDFIKKGNDYDSYIYFKLNNVSSSIYFLIVCWWYIYYM